MTKEEQLKKAIEKAGERAEGSLNGYVDLANKANEQLNSAAPPNAGEWLNLSARAYGRMAGDAAKLWSTGLEMLEILAKE